MNTNTYTSFNGKESAEVVMDDACLGVHLKGRTCVRPTADGRYAVISTYSDELIKVFSDCLHARRYNFAIHGENLDA